MANQLGLQGGLPQKQIRFAPIYTGRWSAGVWTNRSPLRDANTTRIVEKFSGPSGDALIDGLNVEVTNRLTLARRPGNSQYFSADAPVDNFYSFRMFGPNQEKILVMLDHPDSLDYYDGAHHDLFNKSAGAGESYMQSVGNSLYFGNGVDNKKWLQSLITWSANTKWNGATTPFMTTFLIDSNGNIQQLVSTVVPISTTQITSNVLTVTSSQVLTNVLSVGLQVKFPAALAASFLENQVVTIATVSGSTFTAKFNHADSGPTPEVNKFATVLQGGTPISGGTTPVWNTTVPSSSNNFAGGQTVDGTVLWVNRGNPIKNWGIAEPDSPSFKINSARTAWASSTFYSLPSVIIDSNGNLQKVTTAGISGSSAPTWNTSLSGTTADGSVVWTMIQTAASLAWAAGHAYSSGDFVTGISEDGTKCLFQLQEFTQPKLNASVNAWVWSHSHTVNVGVFDKVYPLDTSTALANATGLTSVQFDSGANMSVNPIAWDTINAAGKTTGTTTPFPGQTNDVQYVFTTSMDVPKAGQYTFTINHHDGMIWGIGNGALKVSGPLVDSIGHTQTAVNGYPLMGGTNTSAPYGSSTPPPLTDTFVVNFPTAGTYPVEFDFAFWYHSGLTFTVTCNGNVLAASGARVSGDTEPAWPDWTTTYAPQYPSVSESAGNLVWYNLGPAIDFTWAAGTHFTLPGTQIVDPNGYFQASYRTGISGTSIPTFQTALNALTNDAPNLIWINQGSVNVPPAGTISTYNGGWIYRIALVNTLDNTVSNCGVATVSTGNFIGADSIDLTPGSGLPPLSQIDPQCDYVAIFRSTDGQVLPFLVNGQYNSDYTVPLSEYITNGYSDTTTDENLDSLISGAISGENTPPLAGAVNLTYHLNRIFFSVGNVVYWTSGPDTPVGNGVNGVSPLNFDEFPSLVKRIVPNALGALVFTVSDIFLVTGQGTSTSPILPGVPFLPGVGLLSYNALDVNGSIIGMYTTDKQFVILDPSSGVSYAGFPIGDRLRKNDGQPGTSWNPSSVYVTWHIEGEDQAWYVSDGQFGWYRLMTTPSPETGVTWSAFANIVNGCRAVQSIEVSPGVRKLLVGPSITGAVLMRDLSVSTDNGSAFDAWAVIGSVVLAQPGQVAEVSFITTDAVNIGTPLTLDLILDEALPYYTGAWDSLTNYVNDPYNFPVSTSIIGQRFYLAEMNDAAVCRHMQVKVKFGIQNAASELLSLTLFGAYQQEL